MEIKDRINHYVPMNELEEILKYLFINNIPLNQIDYDSKSFRRIVKAEKNMTVEETIRKFKRFISSAADGRSLTTEIYIPKGRSIYIRKFPRYLIDNVHYHKDAMEINVVMQGEFYQRIGGKMIPMQAGDICFVAPGVAHSTRACDDSTVALSVILYQDVIKKILRNIPQEEHLLLQFLLKIMIGNNYHPYLTCRTGGDADIMGMIMDLEASQDDPGPYTDQYMVTGISMFILRLIMKYTDKIVLGDDIAKNNLDILNLMDYIEANYMTINLNSMARIFNYSPSHLSGLIKSHYGKSFKEILTDIKMAKATELLQKTDYSVTKIAETAGYTDKCYFLRRFKSVYGQTPSEYRAQHRQLIG